MKNSATILLMAFCLHSYAQSHEITGEYATTQGSVHYLLKLHPNGTFHFDSYNKGFHGLPAEPSIGGRGTWSVENGVIYFGTDPEQDIDHNYTLNFNNTKAKYTVRFSEDAANENAADKLEFLQTGIF